MNDAARRENARMLASLMGLDENSAAEKLDIVVAITSDHADPIATQLALRVTKLLERTVTTVVNNAPAPLAAAELVIGNAGRLSGATPVYLTCGNQSAKISLNPLPRETSWSLHSIGVHLCACYAAAALLRTCLPQIPALPAYSCISFDLNEWVGGQLALLDAPIDIGKAHLAGAGAVGNGFAIGLACFPNIRGKLVVCDDDKVSEGNMQR